jgi:YidC/Oxa1 family membrane protein insertase
MPEYRNPQSEPGMERNLLLIFLLLAVVIFASQFFMKRYSPPPAPSNAHPTQPIQPGTPSSAQTVAPNREPSNVLPAKRPRAAEIPQQAQAESAMVVENAVYRISFSNRGAVAKSWVLKKFSDDQGRPLDLVNSPAAAKYGYPLSLWSYDESLRAKLDSVLYVANPGSGSLLAPASLNFEYSDSSLTVRKSFHFDDSYVVTVETSVLVDGRPASAFPAWPAGFGDQSNLQAYAASQFDYQFNNSTEHLTGKKVSGGNTLHGSFDWAGVSSAFFAAVFIPDDPSDVSVVSLHNLIDLAPDASKPNETKPADVLGAAVGRTGETRGRLFVGPKSLEVLEAVHVPTILGADKDLRGLVNFGSLGLIARPLFLWLRWTNSYVHNWGWSIVIQTLIITIALLPLRITQMKSALKMQRVQPQMKAIQERYKKYSMRDPRKQEMQKEIAELYKREGVNPVGGCLPLVVQLPFLWAYYKMLGAAIDLRQAHWLWVHDLSSRDPYFLLPLVMVVSMFVMQKMTPQTGMDPAQQRMMNFMMPAMMGFIFFNLAAGLNLYYAESNLIMILQQAIMNRTELGREMRELAAKRARKKEK